MCRSIVRFFLGTLIVLFAFLSIFLWTLRLQLFDSNYYKYFFAQNDVYNLSIATVKTYISKSTSDQQEGVVIAQPIIDVALDKLITPTFLKDVVEKNLDNAFGWLNGRKEKLFLYFPKQYLLENIDISTIDTLETQVNDIIKSLPRCTPAQEAALQEQEIGLTSNINCLPSSFEFEERDFSEIFEAIQGQTGQNPVEGLFGEQGPLKGLSEEVDIVEFLKNSPREEGSPDPEESVTAVKRNFNYFNLGLIGLSLFTILLSVFYVLLGGLKSSLKSMGVLFILISIPVLISGFLFTVPLEFGEKLFRTYVFVKLPPEIVTELGFLPLLIVKFISGIFFPLLIVGAILLLVGIAGVIADKLIRKDVVTEKIVEKKEIEIEEKKVEPAKPVPATYTKKQ